MNAAEQKIAAHKTEMLIEIMELTLTDQRPEVPTVRGWVMDELERRDPEAFAEWLDSEDGSPRNFFLN